MLNLANPDMAFEVSKLPCEGVGLARLEFIIATNIVGTREALGKTYPFLTSPSDPRSMADAIREEFEGKM